MQKLFVEKHGSGAGVLLLHGLLSDHRQMKPLLRSLRGHTVYMVDLIGCGKSDKIPSTSMVRECVEALEQLCRANDIKIVIGYSIGGVLALHLRLQHTILISSFCTTPLAAGPLHRFYGRERELQHLLLTNRQAVTRLLHGTLPDDMFVPGTREASVDCALQYLWDAHEDHSLLAQRLPHTLVIHGTRDTLINYAMGIELATQAHAPILFVPEGHFSILRNETVLGAIKKFLVGLSALPARARERVAQAAQAGS